MSSVFIIAEDHDFSFGMALASKLISEEKKFFRPVSFCIERRPEILQLRKREAGDNAPLTAAEIEQLHALETKPSNAILLQILRDPAVECVAIDLTSSVAIQFAQQHQMDAPSDTSITKNHEKLLRAIYPHPKFMLLRNEHMANQIATTISRNSGLVVVLCGSEHVTGLPHESGKFVEPSLLLYLREQLDVRPELVWANGKPCSANFSTSEFVRKW